MTISQVKEMRKLQVSMRRKFTNYLKNTFNDNLHSGSHIAVRWKMDLLRGVK